ncbi:MAG: type II toxin-antitoxin system death-on-curing family toxin [Pirellulales bacterium]|nr:type II toxin-antitoxin system death-on-curing family toxin [Pirellulales bacterium]
MPQFLMLDDVLETHAQQIANYGGSEGLRDVGLLLSAVAQPEATFGGQYLHRDLFEMAAAYLFHLVQNHPFVDGNKRVGLEAALLFLEINGHSIEATDDLLVDLVLKTAQGQASKPQIAEFFRARAHPAPQDDD